MDNLSGRFMVMYCLPRYIWSAQGCTLANVPTECRNSGNAHDGKEGELKSKSQTGFVQHLITAKFLTITNILAEDIDQDGDMDIITAAWRNWDFKKNSDILKNPKEAISGYELVNYGELVMRAGASMPLI